MNKNDSDYIVYVDESGDHGLSNIDPSYPIFALVFCVFKKLDYLKIVSNALSIKFKYFNHDMVIFHESDIRRRRKYFKVFDKEKLNLLNIDLADLMKTNNFTIIASVIKKQSLKDKYIKTNNPYHIAMGFCLERLYRLLEEKNEQDKSVNIVFESRGKNEDEELELEFRRWCDGDNFFNKKVDFNIEIADKKVNSTGLQVADLIARPIGLHVLRPEQENKAFSVIENKFRTYNGVYNKAGLKVFP